MKAKLIILVGSLLAAVALGGVCASASDSSAVSNNSSIRINQTAPRSVTEETTTTTKTTTTTLTSKSDSTTTTNNTITTVTSTSTQTSTTTTINSTTKEDFAPHLETRDGETVLCDDNGKTLTGWRTVNGVRMYFSTETGKYVKGFVDIHNARFLTDENGAKLTGLQIRDNNTYYFDENYGQAQKGLTEIDGDSYYFGDDFAAETGIIKISGDEYFFDSNLKLVKDTKFEYQGKKYKSDSSGKIKELKTGWVDEDGVTRWYDSDGNYVTGVVEIDGATYCFSSDGSLLKNTYYNEYKIGGDGKATRMTDSQIKAKNVLDRIGWKINAAFNYASGLKYRSISKDPNMGTEYFANYTFDNQAGNCYGMAAVFYRLAEILNYKVKQINGSVPLRAGGYGPHSWCEILIGDTWYIADPDFTEETGRNGFMLAYGQSGTWKYNYLNIMSEN